MSLVVVVKVLAYGTKGNVRVLRTRISVQGAVVVVGLRDQWKRMSPKDSNQRQDVDDGLALDLNPILRVELVDPGMALRKGLEEEP